MHYNFANFYDRAEASDNDVFLKLKRTKYGLSVIAVDESGEQHPDYLLVTFQDDGSIHRHRTVNKALGFRRNKETQILERPKHA